MVCWEMCLCFVPENNGRDNCIVPLLMRFKAGHTPGLTGNSEFFCHKLEVMGSVALVEGNGEQG